MIAKRLFDIFFSVTAILLLFVPALFLALLIVSGSPGGVFYRQLRTGRNGRPFFLIKFRTMYSGSDRKGQLTIGNSDSRITGIGRFLRKSKADELPQLINILFGRMSFVGPRPEVPKYTQLYNDVQRRVLSIRPGLTDYASLEYINESELLAAQDDPEKHYIECIMPHKLELNLKYIDEMSMKTDLSILWKTFFGIGKNLSP